MGFRVRKSINLGGGFRINLSKSGIGYSWGVPGYRITKTAKGTIRQTSSIPGTGISYVEETGQSPRKPNNYSNNNSYSIDPPMENIESNIKNHGDNAEYDEVIRKIKKNINLNTLSTILIICFILLFGASSSTAFVVLGILLPIAGIVLKIITHTSGRIKFFYTFDDYYKEIYNDRIDKWIKLNSSNKLWQITQQHHSSNLKMNAGASRIINRIPIQINRTTPFYFNTDVKIIRVKLLKEEVFILPDIILIKKNNDFFIVDYKNVTVRQSNTRFIEEGVVPKDAEVVSYTWKYVNKNGGPDRRFKDNRQLSVCLYGVLEFTSHDGLNIEMQCSNRAISEDLGRNLVT